MPSRARLLGPLAPLRLATDPQAERHQRDGDEGRGVHDHGQLQSADGEQQAADHRPDPEAHVAEGLDVAVRLLHAAAGEHRDQRELRGLHQREHDADGGGQHQHRCKRVHERERGGPGRAEHGDDGQQAGRLDPVHEQPGVSGDRHRGPEQADPQRSDGVAVVGQLFDVQSERGNRNPVAHRRKADRDREEQEVALGEQTALCVRAGRQAAQPVNRWGRRRGSRPPSPATSPSSRGSGSRAQSRRAAPTWSGRRRASIPGWPGCR